MKEMEGLTLKSALKGKGKALTGNFLEQYKSNASVRNMVHGGLDIAGLSEMMDRLDLRDQALNEAGPSVESNPSGHMDETAQRARSPDSSLLNQPRLGVSRQALLDAAKDGDVAPPITPEKPSG